MPENSPIRDYVAVLDIGSNAVRLVVYDGMNRAPVKIHNERNVCSLGADLGTTGRLSPEGVEKALQSIGRFAALITAMKIKNVRAVATAALRDAEDGPDFIAQVHKKFGLKIEVVEGAEEARLSAIGVMMNGLGSTGAQAPDLSAAPGRRGGIIGDFGGGSLELIVVDNNRVKHKQSLPIGSHRLHATKGHAARCALIDAQLDTVSFLPKCTGADFYALGGSWRSMAKTHMRMVDHPLKVMDQYTMIGPDALAFSKLLSQQSVASLEKTAGLSKKRVQDMGVAALAMERLLARLQPARLIFSATGLREGVIYDALPPAQQRQDALISSCRKIALKISRFDDLKSFKTMADWMMPLFKGQDSGFFRHLEAACLLSDTGWFEHEDYQAIHAFDRILLLPFYGVDHPGRAFLALANYVRYAGSGLENVARTTRKMLTEEGITLAITAGLAMRVGYLLSGGALSLLKDATFDVSADTLTLVLKKKSIGLHADVITEALQDLAEMMGRRGAVSVVA
jgi:exopolyphosphatase / guanosine-5'-triphosphate,3'-diphosphate pyrophosphatase